MSQRLSGYCYLASAMVMVGSTVVASKLIAGGLPPFTATALRFAIAFPLFLALMRLTAAAWPLPTRHDWVILLVQAAAGSVGYTTQLIAGMRMTSAADAGVIIGTLPVVSAAISIFVLGERPGRATLAAIGLAALGVLSIVFRADSEGRSSMAGTALIFGAVICEGLFILLNKRLQVRISPLAQSTMMSGLGLAAALLPAAVEMPGIASITAVSVGAVAYYALVPTVGGFLLWYAGTARVSGAEASLFTAFAPVSALLLAVLMLDEQVGWPQIAGVGCVLAAVIMLGWSSSKGERKITGAADDPVSSTPV
jgi:drug/metabolite transporter (DMT)-like permease